MGSCRLIAAASLSFLQKQKDNEILYHIGRAEGKAIIMDAKEVKRLRKRKQLTQKALAGMLGVSAGVISAIETGKRKIKQDEEECLLEIFCGCELDETPQAMGYIIYTDGGCACNPGGPGGIGIVIISRDTGEIQEISKGYLATSNNRMEVRAAIEALKSIPEQSQAELYSDSRYLVETMNGQFRMKKNSDLWEELMILDGKRDVRYIWVRGHNGDMYNERCDDLATEGMYSPNKEPDIGFRGMSKRQKTMTPYSDTGGAMGVRIALPDVSPERMTGYDVRPSCKKAMRRFQASGKKFKDYRDLKTGGLDGWSSAKRRDLQKMAGDILWAALDVYFDERGKLACLRWYGRGLSMEDSVRKVLVDQEISANCTRIRRRK